MKPGWFLQPKSRNFVLKCYCILHHQHVTTFHAKTYNFTTISHIFHESWHMRRDNAFRTTNKKNKENKQTKQTVFLCSETRSTYWKGKQQTWIRNSIWKSPFISTHNILPNKGYYLPVQTLFHILQLSCLQQY